MIGLTGMGGGALMTPVLVIFFHVVPTAAISSDVVASVILKPIGGGVHARRGTVNWRLVRWLSVGSVPAAFGGAYAISRISGGGVQNDVKQILGWVLLVAAAGMAAQVDHAGAPEDAADRRDARPRARAARPHRS